MADSIDGKQVAQVLRERIAAVARSSEVVPGLATVLVGDDPASQSYVRSKKRACERAGFHAEDMRLPAETTQAELLELVSALNQRSDLHGILVQQPLPDHIDTELVVAAVDPEKDVDGFHPVNLGRLMRGEPCFIPCTAFGVSWLLTASGIPVAGKRVVIVGRSLLVGKPLALLLLTKNSSNVDDGSTDATVTVCHSRTRNLDSVTREADILVSAIGRPGFIRREMVAEGAVVVDVGINRVDDPESERGYRLVGDVAYDEVAGVAGAITPVPGGVGPMTVAMLLYNTLQSARGLHSQDQL